MCSLLDVITQQPLKEVEVWRIPLDQSLPDTERLARLLSADERQKAAQFRFPGDRSRWTTGRAALRTVLSSYLGQDPAAIRFCYSEAGQPHVIDAGIRFSFSRSGPLALCAVSRDFEVGVDLEFVRQNLTVAEVIDSLFTPREAARIRALPPPEQLQSFFNCWTQKEAYLKALGTGFAGRMQVEVTAVRPNHIEPVGTTEHFVQVFWPSSDAVAALVVNGCDWRAKIHDWQPPGGLDGFWFC